MRIHHNTIQSRGLHQNPPFRNPAFGFCSGFGKPYCSTPRRCPDQGSVGGWASPKDGKAFSAKRIFRSCQQQTSNTTIGVEGSQGRFAQHSILVAAVQAPRPGWAHGGFRHAVAPLPQAASLFRPRRSGARKSDLRAPELKPTRHGAAKATSVDAGRHVWHPIALLGAGHRFLGHPANSQFTCPAL